MLTELKAHAKINIALDVLYKRNDGYHEIRMVIQSLALHDLVNIKESDANIKIHCNDSTIPDGSGNIAYKAAKLVLDRFNIGKGVEIKIEKHIPIAAGLAGGSADAAAVLKGMNRLFSLGLGEKELMELGSRIGADVPFCIMEGTALAEGIGEKITPMPPLPELGVLLVNPGIRVSTEWVYRRLELEKAGQRPDISAVIRSIEEGSIASMARGMGNVLESVTAKEYAVIEKIKQELVKAGASASLMSGSGPTVFGLFEDTEKIESIATALKRDGMNCIITKTYNGEC